MNKTVRTLACTVFCLIVFTACMGGVGNVDKELALKARRIGILSVVMDRVGGDTPGNIQMRDQVLKMALSAYEQELRALSLWEVVPATQYMNNPVFRPLNDIPANPETRPFLMDLANKDQLPLDNEAVFAQAIMSSFSMDAAKLESVKAKAVDVSAQEIQTKVVASVLNDYQGVNGLPVVSYGMSWGEGGGKHHWAAARALTRKGISAACKKLGLDAMVVVHIRSAAEPTGGMHMTVDGRTKGIIKVNPAMVMVASNGQTILSSDFPTMDDLAPMDVGPPVFVGKPGTPSFKVDLKDPKGQVLAAYNALVEKTAKKIVAKVAREMQ